MPNLVTDLRDLLSDGKVLLDVRSPGEYHRGHIPCALNLPIFSDDERTQVGALSRRKGQSVGLLRSLDIFGPKMRQLVETASTYARAKQVAIYCGRGGMRSTAMGWLLELAGFQTALLAGGYKTYRKWTLEQFKIPRRFCLLGGPIGCAKTWVLHALRKMGEQVLDLEALAGHRGSSFGSLGLPPQGTQEHFENKLAYLLQSFDDRPIWAEDEGRLLGTCKIPDDLYAQMIQAPLFIMHRSRTERVNLIWTEFGHHPRDELISAITRITKQLGHERAAEALECIKQGDVYGMIHHVLDYYDKAYARMLARRTANTFSIPDEGYTISQWAEALLRTSEKVEGAHYGSL